ncbi:MAG: MFS transporter [Sphingomonadales bacterium]|nr:MFS transporter [Sphingomonadales bacterium]
MQGIGADSRQEWRDGWKLVLAASFGFSFFSIMAAASGIFIEPLSKEFGWSRTLVSSGMSISALISAILSPFYGLVIDRKGTRLFALPGLALTMLAMCGFAWLTGSPWQWTALWLIYGVISVSVKSTVWTTAVAGVFDRGRGLALGITLSGTAFAQMVTPPLANWLIATQGWRMAYVWLGLGWGGLALLLCWLFLFDAHDRGKARVEQGGKAHDSTLLPGLTLAQALRDTALWRIGISTFIMMVLTIGLMVHVFQILREAGVSRENAAWLSSLSGFFGIVGKLVTGWLLDRFRPNWVGGLTLGATALAFAFLMDGIRSPWIIACAMIVNGYSAGTKIQIAGYLTTRYGGLKYFGTIFGVMAAAIAAGSGLGPVFAGKIYDSAGGYGPFLLIGTIGSAFCGLLILSLPKYPVWGSSSGGATSGA